MKNHAIVTTAVALLVGIAGFAGGDLYQKHRDSLAGVAPQDLPQKLQSLGYAPASGQGGFAGRFGSGAGGGRRGGAGGAVTGDIISKEDQSVTVKLADGSTRVVYFSGSTAIGASTPATSGDLAVGKSVLATGTPNSDGSITAQNIQIRPSK